MSCSRVSVVFVVLVTLFYRCPMFAAKPSDYQPVEKWASAEVAKAMVERCPKVAFIRRANYGMTGTNATMFARGTDVGAAICVYDPSRPNEPIKTIFETREGFVFDMSPSYDGEKLVFSHKVRRDEPFHLWEIRTDGMDLRQLTEGRYHDVSGVYYPDGRIVFVSSRVEGYSYCQNFLASALYICQADGQDIRRIDFTTICSCSPTILADGRILFTRWEYQDKNIFSWEGLWTLKPNGRQLELFHGNTFTVPNSVYGAKQLPGSGRVVTTMAAHHHVPIGDLALIDRSKGLESMASICKLTDATPYQIAKAPAWNRSPNWRPGDTLYPYAFADPFPVSEDLMVASYQGIRGDLADPHHRLVLLTLDGVMTPLVELPDASCFCAVPLDERRMPHTIAGDAPTQAGEGRFFVRDVYQGLLKYGVERGQVKALRVMQQPQKKYNTEGPRYHDHYPIVGQGSYYIKKNLGTIPVAEDGSAFFLVPSNVELYFEALDAAGKEIRRMGSVTQITTGETAVCIGCHENRLHSPQLTDVGSFDTLRRKPDRIRPPSWGAGFVDYPKQVQPVLDRYCVKCHDGPVPDGDLNLSGDKTRFYSMSYESLVFRNYVEYYYINQGPTGVFEPMASGSWVSRLTQLLEERHGEVNVDDQARRAIYAWIDANVPYYSTWEMTRPHSQGGRDAYARPGDTDPLQPVLFHWVDKYQQLTKTLGIHPDRDPINFTHPEFSPALYNYLAQSAGGRAKDAKALFRSKDDPRFKELLGILHEAKRSLDTVPRIDMPGAKSIPQHRDFGRTF